MSDLSNHLIFKESNQDTNNSMVNYLEGDAKLRCSNESTSMDPVLEPKHKIFLSHNGAQKEFVEYLCKAWEDRWRYPFFDRRPKSLPKGERFLELIIQAARQCNMLIVVVSNEYFMSKWPMIELNAFVKAHELNCKAKGPDGGPKILPLFYGLSVRDLEDEAMQKKWFENWEKLAKDDPKGRIVVNDWKYALDVLRSFNGLEYNKEMKEITAYENDIVTHVCKSIGFDLKQKDSHVQGKSSICKVIGEKIQSTRVSKKYHVKVVGIHGVGGIGKTTTCKTLLNELSNNYEGLVCHVEFPSVPLKDSIVLLQKVLVDLTMKNKEEIENLDEGMCENALETSLSKKKVFLAIDNVWDDNKSMKHAKMFLEVPYHRDSLVIVTARSKCILERLGIDGDACVEMLELEKVDAIKLFLHHATQGKEFNGDDMGHILECIKRCYFSKGVGLGYHYHPLALEALGLQMHHHGENPSVWVKKLPQVRTFSSSGRANLVFDILRSHFDLLPSSEQILFMDLALLDKIADVCFDGRWSIKWLYDLYEDDKDEFQDQLENLKQNGLLQNVDLTTGKITMHDLYFEFAELEAKGFFNKSKNLRKRKWMYVKNGDLEELIRTPKDGCWPKLRRLAIDRCDIVAPYDYATPVRTACLEGIQWGHFSNVEVLHLCGLRWGWGTLNLEHLVFLRVLCLVDNEELSSLEGLGKLKKLTRFTWTPFIGDDFSQTPTDLVGQLPSSLKTLYIHGPVVLGLDFLAQCQSLSNLELARVEARVEASTLDLSKCASLESVILRGFLNFQTLLGLAACRPFNLQSLELGYWFDLIDFPGLNHVVGLTRLEIFHCPKFEVHGLPTCIKLPYSRSSSPGAAGVESLVVGAQNFIPCQLQGLSCSSSQSMEGPNPNGFNQLEDLYLSENDGLASLEGLADLPALRSLKLRGCKSLLRLPDLSKSRKLEDLLLAGCDALKLYEKDIQMLSELPLLLVSTGYCFPQFRFDFIRQKAVVHSCKERHWVPRFGLLWKEHEWEERDLGTPPITLQGMAL